MKLETFFENFDHLLGTPGSTAKIRGLTLELATRGRLVRQDPSEEAAPIFLSRLSREMPEKERTRQAAPQPPVDADSVPYVVPTGWTWARFRDVAIIASNLVKPKDFLDLPHLAPDNIEKGTGVLLACSTVREDKVVSSNHRFYVGQLVYSKIRPNLSKVVVATFDGLCSADMYPVDPLICARYLQIYMLSKAFLAQAVKSDTRVAMPKINQAELNAIVVAVPPLAEQDRIVAEVHELMELCDELDAHEKERETRRATLGQASLARFAEAPTAANLNFLFHDSYTIQPADLRKSILTLAVQGKLVPQTSGHEDVERTLAQNDGQRGEVAKHDRRADAERLPLLSDEDRWEIPRTWSWCALADLVLFIDYRGKTPLKVSGGIRLLTAKNVRAGQINRDPEEFVSQKEYEKWMTRGIPKAGDVLFTTEAPMGYAAVVDLAEPFALAQRVICFRGYGAVDPAFLVLQILSDEFQFLLDKNGTGVTAKGIKAAKLRHLPIAIAPLTEQRRIVARVNQLVTLVDRMEAQIAASKATGEALAKAIVAELISQT